MCIAAQSWQRLKFQESRLCSPAGPAMLSSPRHASENVIYEPKLFPCERSNIALCFALICSALLCSVVFCFALLVFTVNNGQTHQSDVTLCSDARRSDHAGCTSVSRILEGQRQETAVPHGSPAAARENTANLPATHVEGPRQERAAPQRVSLLGA